PNRRERRVDVEHRDVIFLARIYDARRLKAALAGMTDHDVARTRDHVIRGHDQVLVDREAGAVTRLRKRDVDPITGVLECLRTDGTDGEHANRRGVYARVADRVFGAAITRSKPHNEEHVHARDALPRMTWWSDES